MKHNVWTIMKKELMRFFQDKKMVVTTVFLPGIMIYIMYSFMGSAMTSHYTVEDDYRYQICTLNFPQELEADFIEAGCEISEITEAELDIEKQQIQQQEQDLLVVFPKDFIAQVERYDVSMGQAPDVELYYNSVSTSSGEAYDVVENLLNTYENALANRFDINGAGNQNNLATEKEQAGEIFSNLMPMLLILFLFSGCMSVAPESIAGEKERGTIATLLVTPMKRSALALGKICALSIISLLSGLGSFLGTMLSLPKLMGGEIDSGTYGVWEYMVLLLVILATVLILVSLISIISAYANTVKQASAAIMPLMLLVMMVGMSSMFQNEPRTIWYWFLIPVYNSTQLITNVLSFQGTGMQVGVTVASNLVFTAGCVWALKNIFNSEKIMFSK